MQNPKTYEITVRDVVITVKRKNVKNLRLDILPPDGRVVAVAPLNIKDEQISAFAAQKMSLIKRYQQQKQSQEYQPEKKYFSGEMHYFMGKTYQLNVVYHQGKASVEIRDNYLDLYVKEGSNETQRQKILHDWYRQHLKEAIPPMIKKWEPIMKVEVEDWGIKLMKNYWGTCNIQDKRIWLNLKLAEKEVECFEYIVVHEMTHLLERNHTKRFHSLMDRFLPNWRKLKEDLNRII